MSLIRDRIDRLPLGGKINLTVLVSCGAALAIAAGVHIAKEIIDYRPALEAENRKLAQVVAANVSAAVLFDDVEAMKENLDAFSRIPEIHSAVIRDDDGEVLARYVKANPKLADTAYEQDLPGTFRIASGIVVRGDNVGTLELVVGLGALEAAIRDYVIVAVLALVISFLPALGVIRVLKPTVLRPLTSLRETMERIAATQDYAARVGQVVDDEFGQLGNRFNAMLEEIQRRDHSLARVARDMAAAKELAEAANETKTKFIANMSHELRTPLNAIFGYAEMVIEDLEDTGHDTQIVDLQRILTAASHLLNLINDVLDVARIESGRLELHLKPTDMRPLIEEAVESVRPTALKNGNTLSAVVDEAVNTTSADPVRLRQCLLNLLSNACKFTENGRIALRASVEGAGADAMMRIDIEDTGIGIEPDKLEMLFRPFVQIDSSMTRNQGGSGLGLAITRDILELMNGSVSVTSTPGQGSVFTIRIPCDADASDADEPLQGSETALNADQDAILVVEDANDSALLLERWLTPAGYQVVITNTGGEGLAAVEKLHPDLLILDLDLPDISGWTMLEKLADRGRQSFVPVIVATVSEDRGRALAMGACELITKPVQKSKLVEMVEAHLSAPPARVLLEAPVGGVGLLETALVSAGHCVERTAADALRKREIDTDGFDCVVIDASLPLRDAGDTEANMTWIRSIPCDVVLWCGGELRPPLRTEIDQSAVPVTTSLTEVLVAVRKTMLAEHGA
jgi:signal transduction histidine kinase/CheY-like chemotaxis protein